MPSAGRKALLVRELSKFFEVHAGYSADDVHVLSACREAFGLVPLPQSNDSQYPEALLDAVKDHEIDLVLPVRNGDMPVLDGLRKEIEALGAELILSRGDTVEACNDKLVLRSFVSQGLARYSRRVEGVLTEEYSTWVARKDRRFPVFVKPRHGSGSRGVRVAWGLPDPGDRGPEVVQPLLVGREYTADMFFDSRYRWVQTVLRLRVSARDGQMDEGRVVEDFFTPELNIEGSGGWNTQGFLGPINVQFFECNDGKLRITDINPRFSGGIPLSIAAGANFVEYLYQLWKGVAIRPTPPLIGQRATSYTDYVYWKD
jgi:carbamoyl-phosphate synthase large subunit